MRRQQCMAQVVSFVVITLCVLAVPALAQNCPEPVSQWPYGPSWAVAVSGDYAYFGSNSALMVADVSNPEAPRAVGDVALPDTQYATVLGIAVSGGYAGVAGGDTGFRIVDVSNPSAPVEAGFVETPGYAWGVEFDGGYAYVVDRRLVFGLLISARRPRPWRWASSTRQAPPSESMLRPATRS